MARSVENQVVVEIFLFMVTFLSPSGAADNAKAHLASLLKNSSGTAYVPDWIHLSLVMRTVVD